MSKDHLRDSLEHLLNDLKKAHSTDRRVQKKIQDLSADLRALLEHSGEFTPEHHRNLETRLREAVGHFEASHPELTSVINNVLTTLANSGI